MPQGSKAHLQAAFLNALMAMPTIEQAAQRVGIAKSTAQRWLQSPSFQAAYAEARRMALAETIAFLQQSMLKAVTLLTAVLTDPEARVSNKIQAARAILEFGMRATEQDEVIARLRRLEEHFLQKGSV
jgi:hypothetical protein